MTASKTRIAEDLQAHFSSIFGSQLRPGLVEAPPAPAERAEAPVRPSPPPLPSENIVRPAAFRRPSDPAPAARARPELAAALSNVGRVSDLIREAEHNADRHAKRAIDIAFRSMAQLEVFEAKLADAHAALAHTADRSEEEIRRLLGEIELRDRKIAELECRAAALSVEQGRHVSALKDATERAAAAEAHAAETLQDLKFLADRVSEVLAIAAEAPEA